MYNKGSKEETADIICFRVCFDVCLIVIRPRLSELAQDSDLKSDGSNTVWVRIPYLGRVTIDTVVGVREVEV